MCVLSFYIFYFFFFQAEDGIRDRNVTGVQTCALPISNSPKRAASNQACGCSATGAASGDRDMVLLHPDLAVGEEVPVHGRSEERRVGKECRSRWAQEQYERNER